MSIDEHRGDLPPGSRRELIVVAKSQVGLVASREKIMSVTGADVKPLRDLFDSKGITLRPLFCMSEEQLRREAKTIISSAGADVPAASDLIRLSLFYGVDTPDDRSVLRYAIQCWMGTRNPRTRAKSDMPPPEWSN